MKFNPLTVRQVLQMANHIWYEQRDELLEDLDDCGITGEPRLERLRQHREQKGSATIVVTHALTLDGALAVLEESCGGELPKEAETIEAKEAIRLALLCLGVDFIDLEGSESSAEGKEPLAET